jgi:hypothetical protein
MTNYQAWSVLLIRPRVSGDELNFSKQPDLSKEGIVTNRRACAGDGKRCRYHHCSQSSSKPIMLLCPNKVSMRNHLVFFHLTLHALHVEMQVNSKFADSIVSETSLGTMWQLAL